MPVRSTLSYKNQTANLCRQRAREWFEQQTRDFRLVCELAGLEAQRVHQFAMTKIRETIEAEQRATIETLKAKETIEQENARTAELLTSAMPGVVQNFLQVAPDRHTSDTREIEKIGFSQNEVSPS